jgi:hypothetical protein
VKGFRGDGQAIPIRQPYIAGTPTSHDTLESHVFQRDFPRSFSGETSHRTLKRAGKTESRQDPVAALKKLPRTSFRQACSTLIETFFGQMNWF